MALWQYQQLGQPVLLIEPETGIDTKAWRPVLPDNVPRLNILPTALVATSIFVSPVSPIVGPHTLNPGPDVIRPLVRIWPQDSAWTPQQPAAEVDWLPCVWMEEGVEEAMVASGTTAYQEQEADILRLAGDPVTLDGVPIRVVS